MSAEAEEVEFQESDWFTMAAILLYKLGGSADISYTDTLAPLGHKVEVEKTAEGMALRLVKDVADG